MKTECDEIRSRRQQKQKLKQKQKILKEMLGLGLGQTKGVLSCVYDCIFGRSGEYTMRS